MQRKLSKKRRATMLMLLALTFAVVGLTRQAAAQTSEETAPPMDAKSPLSDYKEIEKLPHGVTLATLSNGLTVIVQENHVAPVATVRCFVRNTGSAFEGKYLGAGLSHVLEHVVAGGTTKKRSGKEIEKLIDEFGGATNAFTSKDITCYFIDCPAKDSDLAIELIADSMQHITFEPEEFERELKVVQQELRDGEVDRRRVVWHALARTVYTKHPARHPIIGYLDVLQGTKNEEIIDFYRDRYVPNNQVFVVVGDIETDHVLQEVAKQFADTPRGRETLITMGSEPRQLAPRTAYREMDGGTYDVVLAWPTVELSHPDLYALDVAAYILAEGSSSRLVRRLKYEEQLVLSVSSASYTPEYVNGYFAVFAAASPDKWEQARDEILEEVYRLRNEPVDPQTLAKAKKQKATELVFQQQTVQQAADSLGRSFVSTGDPLFDETYVAGIQGVTAEQIQKVAREYFVPERLNTVVITPPGGAPTEAAVSQTVENGDIKAYCLDNGVRVLLKRHANLPLVNMQVTTLGACLADTPENAGRASLTAMMLDKGTPSLDARQIAEYFDSIGGAFGVTSGRNTLTASASVMKEDFPRVAAILAECVTQPTFPEDEFAGMKQLALGNIARRADNPQQEALEFFFGNLPATTPYHVIQGGTKESVEPLAIDDLKQYHDQLLVPQNMLVTVFGDIDIDETMKLVEQQFGSLKPSPNWKPISFDRANALAQSREIHKETGKPTGIVLMGYPAVSVHQSKDHAALTVLDAIMSGYGYPGGWLHTELRGEGLVYGVHAFVVSGPAPGYFMVMAQTSPESVDEVVRRVRKNVEKAKAGEITVEEFERAKRMIIALHAQDNTTIASQAQQAALDDLYGLGYDYDKSFDDRINAVTLDDVIGAANKYLNDCLTATVSPKP